eukprot:403332533
MKSALAQAVESQVVDFKTMMQQLQDQKQSHLRSKTTEHKNEARQKMKELQPKKPKEVQQPWRETHNHNYCFENDPKRLQGVALSNKEIYRIHLLPRSYDTTIPAGKTEAFKLTSNFGKDFNKDYSKMLTQQGKTIIQNNHKLFNETVEKKRQEELHYLNNRRQYAEQSIMPKWDPTAFHGTEFSNYEADFAKYHKKSLLPLDKKPLQEKPFLRTGTTTNPFSHTIGSII